jgi:hypothetical protein
MAHVDSLTRNSAARLQCQGTCSEPTHLHPSCLSIHFAPCGHGQVGRRGTQPASETWTPPALSAYSCNHGLEAFLALHFIVNNAHNVPILT